jgi:predicted cation transporter
MSKANRAFYIILKLLTSNFLLQVIISFLYNLFNFRGVISYQQSNILIPVYEQQLNSNVSK